MGKFESYPQASTLADEDITLFNKNTLTHKISFGTLYNLIRTKLQNGGMVTSVSTGAGLTGGAITSVGTIKCNLVSETNSSLPSNVITEIVGRQYAVVPDSNGKLSVNVPWETVPLANNMLTDGSNAASHVSFNSAFTVGNRQIRSGVAVGTNSISIGSDNIANSAYSCAEGRKTQSAGTASHSEGHSSWDIADTQQEEDMPAQYQTSTCSISAMNDGSHAEGYTNHDVQYNIVGVIQASGLGAHAEGCALGGDSTNCIIASGKGAHAEGCASYDTSGDDNNWIIASGDGSHAEGSCTHARGMASHAEGINCYANGIASHAEGRNTSVFGNYSHGSGNGTSIYSDYQFGHSGEDYKFGKGSYGVGQFGIQPNGKYYTTDTTIPQNYCRYGQGGTVQGGVIITLTLSEGAIYQLYWALYSNKQATKVGADIIATPVSTVTTPVVTHLTSDSIIYTPSYNTIELRSNSDYMFHLIRII